MVKEITSFSTNLLNDYSKLKSFLSGESTINFLKNNADKIQLPKANTLYFGRWQVVWIICKYPFEWILSLFFTAMSTLTSYVGPTCLSQFFYILSEQVTRDHQQYERQESYKKRLLVPAFNVPQIGAYDVYTQSPFPIDQIKDPKVKDVSANNFFFLQGVKEGLNLFYANVKYYKSKENSSIQVPPKKEIIKHFKALVLNQGLDAGMDMLEKIFPHPKMNKVIAAVYLKFKQFDSYRASDCSKMVFFTPRGVCRGGTIWFIYLYLKTLPFVQNPKKLLISIAEIFRTGVPSQGCFFQDSQNEKVILDLKGKHQKEASVTLFELDMKNKSMIDQKLKNLSPGAYFLGVRRHALAYFKISETEGYMWNPNSGLIELLDGKNQAEELCDDILHNYHTKGDIEVKIQVTKMSLAPKKELQVVSA